MAELYKLCEDYNTEKIESVQECMDAVSQIRNRDQLTYWGGTRYTSDSNEGCYIPSTGTIPDQPSQVIYWNTNANTHNKNPRSYEICIGNGMLVGLRNINI